MTEEKPQRVFLAIDLPEDIKNRLIDIQDRLNFLLKGVRWVRPEGIHLTLKFFGDVFEDDITRISHIVAGNTNTVPPVSLAGERIGAFPRIEKPRVLWLGINGDVDKLSRLHGAIETELAKHGYRKEKRRFSPHLTLGRATSFRGVIIGLADVLKREEQYTVGGFESRGLTLFQSELRPEGAVYTKLAYFPFTG